MFLWIESLGFESTSTCLGQINGQFIFFEFCEFHSEHTRLFVSVDKLALVGEREDGQHVFGLEDRGGSSEIFEYDFVYGLLKGVAAQIFDGDVFVDGFPESA